MYIHALCCSVEATKRLLASLEVDMFRVEQVLYGVCTYSTERYFVGCVVSVRQSGTRELIPQPGEPLAVPVLRSTYVHTEMKPTPTPVSTMRGGEGNGTSRK